MHHYVIYLVLLVSFGLSGQNPTLSKQMYVIASGGLNVRKEANLTAEKIAHLPRGTKILMEPSLSKELVTLSNGYTGNWVKVFHNDTEGFVFDAYLSEISPIEFKDISNGCWRNDILKDWAEKIGKVDSTGYYNYSDGEGSYAIHLYNLANKGKYIEHLHWEAIENEIQLHHLKREEIVQFVGSIVEFCKDKKNTINFMNDVHIEYHSIWKEEDCCVHKLQVKVVEGVLVIRIQISPGA